LLAERGAALPETPGADLVVQHEITGAPGGKVRFVIEWRDGRVVRAEAGKAADPDCVIQAKASDALRVLAGEVEPEVAWMQGRLKIDGAYREMLIDLRPWRHSDAYKALWTEMAERTA